MEREIKYKPVSGKTYSLFGSTTSTEPYYNFIKQLIDKCLNQNRDIEEVLKIVRKASHRKLFLDSLFRQNKYFKVIALINDKVSEQFSSYTYNVKQHLKSLSFFEKWDKTLSTNEIQYHYYMLEIELINRMNKDKFKECKYKIALLPHCLRDFRKKCLAEMADLDYICKECTKGCIINLATNLLKRYNIDAYIATIMNQKSLLKKYKSNHQSLGVLGIACIPELVNGLRLCESEHISAIGIPLDANRCSRWMEKCYENSFNLERLENLIK
jgi:hypothetical protein